MSAAITLAAAAAATGRVSYSVREAAAQTGLGIDSIRAAIRSRDLVVHYPNAKGVILAADLVAWIENAPTERPA